MNTSLHSRRILLLCSCLFFLSSCGKKIITESDRIRIVEPKPNAVLTSPFLIRGEARVYEGTVHYQLTDEDGVIATGFTTAHVQDIGEFSPFEASVTFTTPFGEKGELRLFEESAEDGSEVGKVEIPVRF